MIYKGCCKKMIVLKNTGSDLFEEAYFVLNDKNSKSCVMNETDMVKEANKIISTDLLSGYFTNKPADKKLSSKKGRLLAYFIGLISGITAYTVIYLIIR